MNKPRLAIITACYNVHPDLIWWHFLSIDQQNMGDSIIHVIVDDASTNKDTKLALYAAADARKSNTVVISLKENKGPGGARNRAIEYLKKFPSIEFACLLDMDDYLEPDSLKIRMQFLEEPTDYIAVYGNKFLSTFEINEDDKEHLEEIEKRLEKVPLFDKSRLFRECYVPSCSVMFKWAPFVEFIKEFREDVRLCEDWLIWRKLALLGKFKKIELPIYTQTMHGGNLTTNPQVLTNHYKDMVTTKMDLDEWIRNYQGQGIIKF
jgi:glycosyltransferase involved in cell wall biosynthesis